MGNGRGERSCQRSVKKGAVIARVVTSRSIVIAGHPWSAVKSFLNATGNLPRSGRPAKPSEPPWATKKTDDMHASGYSAFVPHVHPYVRLANSYGSTTYESGQTKTTNAGARDRLGWALERQNWDATDSKGIL